MAKKIHFTKKLVAIIVALLVVIAVGGYFFYDRVLNREENTTPTEQAQQYPGPSPEEKKEAEDNKEALLKRNEERLKPDTSTGVRAVTPVITTSSQNGDQVTITAYVPGIFENGGSCTMKATRGDKTVTKTSEAFANATTTDCAPFFMNKSEFSPVGEWDITITYKSSKAEGTSQPGVLAVQ